MTMDDDDEIMDAVLDSPPAQPTPAPAGPATPPASGSQENDADDDEYNEDYDEDYAGFMDGLYEKLTLGPLDGRHTFKILGVLVVLLIFLLSLTSASIGFYSGCSKVTMTIEQPEFVTDNDFDFYAYISPPFLGRIDRSDVDYHIIYDNEVIYTGTFTFNKNNKAQDQLDIADFYVDNGEYTVKVTACGKTGSDTQQIKRTIKAVVPDLRLSEGQDGDNQDDDYMLLGLGLRANSDPTDDYKPPTKGNGTVKLYYCENEPECGSARDLRETVTFDINMDSFSWTIQSDGTTSTQGFITLDRDYWYDGNDGYYSAYVDFTNTFTDNEGHDDELKSGHSLPWVEDFQD